DRTFGPHVIRHQRRALHRHMGGRSGKGLKREGFRHVFTLRTEEDVEAATVTRTPLWNNRRHDHGPFDIIGDIHGCFDELVELLEALGYQIKRDPAAAEGDWEVIAPRAEPQSPSGTGVPPVRTASAVQTADTPSTAAAATAEVAQHPAPPASTGPKGPAPIATGQPST